MRAKARRFLLTLHALGYVRKQGRSFELAPRVLQLGYAFLSANDTEMIHFIGKDIIYFHTLFWPAMLHFSGRKVPDHVYVHGFITVSGEKITRQEVSDLMRQQQDRLRQMLGKNFDPAMLESPGMRAELLEGLINQRLLLDAEGDIEVAGEAGSVDQAVFEARAHKPDIILMDVVMPGRSGIEGAPAVLHEAPAAKLLVGAGAGDPALGEDEDQRGVADGGEAVGDDEHRLADHEFLQRGDGTAARREHRSGQSRRRHLDEVPHGGFPLWQIVARRSGIDIRTSRDQCSDDCRAIVRRGIHERRLPLPALHDIDRRTALDQQLERLRLHRLFEEPKRTEIVNGGDGGLEAPECGLHDGGRRVALVLQALEQFLAGDARHVEIGDDDIGRKVGELVERVRTVARGLDGIAPQG